MCQYFDPNVAKKCTEDDAEEVIEKERLNFCEWYQPAASTFDPQRAAEESQARGELESLFSDDGGVKSDGNGALRDAEDIFK